MTTDNGRAGTEMATATADEQTPMAKDATSPTTDGQTGLSLEQPESQPASPVLTRPQTFTEGDRRRFAAGMSHPEVYTPAASLDASSNLSEAQQLNLIRDKNISDNMNQRVARVVALFVVNFCMMVFCFSWMRPRTTEDPDAIQLIQLYGIVLACLHTMAISQFFIMWCTAYRTPGQYLYRIHTLNSTPKDWMAMSISYKAIQIKTHPIESISEMSAIQGGRANYILYGTSQATLTLVLGALVQEITYKRFSVWDPSDVFVLIGTVGLVVIGLFELDPNNKALIRGHYAGVFMSFFCLVAFNVQVFEMVLIDDHYDGVGNGTAPGGWIAFPVLLDIFSLGGLASWQWSLHQGKQFTETIKDKKELTEEERQQISTFSMRNLVSEAVFFICMATSLCAWLIMYREYCVNCAESQCEILDCGCNAE